MSTETNGRKRLSHRRNRNLIFFLLFDILIGVFVTSTIIEPSSGGLIRFSIHFTRDFLANLPLLCLFILIQLLLSYSILFIIVLTNSVRLTEKNRNQQFGKFDGEWIEQTVNDLCRRRGVRCLSRIYIIQQPIPNALTFDAVPIPFIRRSWLVIFSNLFDILSPEELRAVIAHEVEHITNRDTTYRLLTLQPYASIMILFIIIQLKMLWIIIIEGTIDDRIIRLLDLIIFSVCISYITRFGQVLATRVNNAMELLADNGAAELTGAIAIINALIKLGQRNEAVMAMNIRLKKLQRKLPSSNTSELAKLQKAAQKSLAGDEFDEQRAQEAANKAFISYYLKKLKSQYSGGLEPSGAEIRHRTEQLTETILSVSSYDPELSKERVDWREYDDHIRDFQLDAIELENLIRDLRSSSEKPMFPIQETMAGKARNLTHPFIKDRVVTLYADFIEPV